MPFSTRTGIASTLRNRSTLRWTTFGLALNTWAFPVHGQGQEMGRAALHVIWSTPITVETVLLPQTGQPGITPREEGISLGQSVDRNGQITLLARSSDYYAATDVLLSNFELNGFRNMVRPQLKGTQSDSPSTLLAKLFGMKQNAPSRVPIVGSMTIDNEGMVWVGGATGHYTGIASDPHSQAYLARLDSSAIPIWERSYKAGNVPFVASMTPTATGDVLVAATDGWLGPSWLALIAAKDGSVVWERRFGNGSGVAVTPMTDDAFLVATFDSAGKGSAYQEDVAVRSVTIKGEVGPPTVVRPAVSKQDGSRYGTIRMSPTSDGAYVVSTWEVPFEQDPAQLKPSEIAKVDTEGHLVWRATIPTGFAVNANQHGAAFCDNPAVATLPDGDGLVACALKGQIHTHRFNRFPGADRQGSMPLPACCDGEHPVALFLFARPDGQVLISGTRPSGNVGPGCSWLARFLVNGV